MKTWRCRLTAADGAQLEVTEVCERPPLKIVRHLRQTALPLDAPPDDAREWRPGERTYCLKRLHHVDTSFGVAYYEEAF